MGEGNEEFNSTENTNDPLFDASSILIPSQGGNRFIAAFSGAIGVLR
jgi:hypothetical protein